MHELDILKMVHASAVRSRGDRVRDMSVRGQTEFFKAREEMIVAGFVARPPVAHRPGIDHLVVEYVIAVTAAGCGFGGIGFTGVAGRCDQAGRCAVHAQSAIRGEIHEIFGVDCAIQMIVQISALGQVADKSQQQLRLLANAVQR